MVSGFSPGPDGHPLAAGLPVAVFSMEMGATQLALRLIGSVGRLDQHKLRTGRLANEDWEKLTGALGRLNEAPILIDETPALNAIEVRSRARRLLKQYGKLGLVIVDEQHRFGVVQRDELVRRAATCGLTPHMLAMTATPTSAKTAPQRVAIPTVPRARNSPLMPSAMTMFCQTMARVRRLEPQRAMLVRGASGAGKSIVVPKEVRKTPLAAAMSTMSSQLRTMGSAIGHGVMEKGMGLKAEKHVRVIRLAILAGIQITTLTAYYLPSFFTDGAMIVANGTSLFFGLCARRFPH